MTAPAFVKPPLTSAGVELAYQALEASLPGPDADLPAWEACFWAWNDLKLWIVGESSRRYYREAQDMRDEAAAAAFRFMREAIFPAQEAGDGRVRARFLASPRRAELEALVGEQLFRRLELDQAAFMPLNIELSTLEGGVVSEVERCYGNAQIHVGAEQVGLSRANGLLLDPELGRRKSAWLGITAYLSEHREQFHAWYDRLTALRHQMALNLDEADFTAVGYRKMGRTDYGPNEVATFRESIRTHITPLLARVRAAQAGWLGADTVSPWDMTCFPGLSLGPSVAPVSEQLGRASRLFHALHPRLAGHFDRMVELGLIDLEARPGKRPGPFAIAFEDEAKIAIFCNSTGAESDITTLTHEMGHAFQAWESLAIRPLEARLATMDAAELTSMGMEYLALREIGAFLTPDHAARFGRLKLINALQRMAYVAVVDEFQHWVYANPGHTHTEREEAWERSWDTYVPGIDFSLDPLGKRLRWMRQSHLFAAPFYYIDYALAEVGALQLWRLDRLDHSQAMESYLTACRLGGTRSMVGIFAEAGLQSPFEPGVLAPLVAELARELAL